ncbi:basic blue protein-like [Oryza brachyantha]|uniref:Plantacyanin n=1 Tax=Oryza brachyantha TaxID=4533 RepID=J3LXU3_ORYBR|nr:basic blue protein-like [Oryza brachyantha]
MSRACGRGGADKACRFVHLGLLLDVVLALRRGVQPAAASQREWPVGDSSGWTFGVVGWPNYKPFKSGDVLVFTYDPSSHNVVAVSDVDYALCKVPANATTYSSGDDRVTLSRGVAFFICGFPGHCDKGMKIAVTAR